MNSATNQRLNLLQEWSEDQNKELPGNQHRLIKNSVNGKYSAWHITKEKGERPQAFCGNRVPTNLKNMPQPRTINLSDKPEQVIGLGQLCGNCRKKWKQKVNEPE